MIIFVLFSLCPYVVTVQTGAITSVCAILDMVFYLVDTSGM